MTTVMRPPRSCDVAHPKHNTHGFFLFVQCCCCCVNMFVATRNPHFIQTAHDVPHFQGHVAPLVEGRGAGGRERLRAGGRLILARDALLCSITGVGSDACELTNLPWPGIPPSKGH